MKRFSRSKRGERGIKTTQLIYNNLIIIENKIQNKDASDSQTKGAYNAQDFANARPTVKVCISSPGNVLKCLSYRGTFVTSLTLVHPVRFS